MSDKVNFYLNGQEYTLYKYITLSQLIKYFDYKDILFVVEHNNIICDQKNWNDINLLSEDIIEIITIVGGG